MIKLNTETLRYIAALEKESGVFVKDCFLSGDTIFYVVDEGKLGAAIGKNGVNVKKISGSIDKKVHLVEFSQNPVKFTENLLGGAKAKTIVVVDSETKKSVVIECEAKTKGTILGKNGKNIQMIKDLLKRHHQIDEVVLK